MRIAVFIGITIILLAGGGTIYYLQTAIPESKTEEGTLRVKRGTVEQVISLNGKLQSIEEIELAFDRSGKISLVPVAIGANVQKGQILVSLDNGDVREQLRAAEADLEFEHARLSELTRGPREEELRVADAKVNQATSALTETKNTLYVRLVEAQTKSDDAVRSYLDKMITNAQTQTPRVSIEGTFSTPNIKETIESGRRGLEKELAEWFLEIQSLTPEGNLAAALSRTYAHLNPVRTILKNMAILLNEAKASPAQTQATLDLYRTDISTARNTVETILTGLAAAEEKRQSAISTLNVAEEERARTRAGFSSEEIQAQEARIRQTEAQARRLRVEMEKMALKAPFAGIVSKIDAQVGESVLPGKIILTLSTLQYEITVNIPEADINKISTQSRAIVIFDSYGDDIEFEAEVKSIQPKETKIEGVATYKSVLRLLETSPLLRSGISADIKFIAARKEDTLIVPQRAIIRKAGERFVRVLNAKGESEEKKVKIGITGSNGFVEVVEGLEEGERIVIAF